MSSIKSYLPLLPTQSGIYQMFDHQGRCLYVGKAKDLRKRVKSYTQTHKLSPRILHMVQSTVSMNHIVTSSEEEALILEANLIKSLRPKYNILLRDDKSFPFIELTLEDAFPRMRKVRTKKALHQNLFGPFASVQTLEEIYQLVQRMFKLRVCSNTTFHNRTRPCIYYQIQRCSAPCVSKISEPLYQQETTKAIDFLKGNTRQLATSLTAAMEKAAQQDNFEQALAYRDQLKILGALNVNFSVLLPGNVEADVITLEQAPHGVTAVQVIPFRGGRSVGLFHYFPEHTEELTPAEIMSSFLMHYYKGRELPEVIYANRMPQNVALVNRALNQQNGKPTKISQVPAKIRQKISEFAQRNLKIAIEQNVQQHLTWQPNFEELAYILQVPISRIEVYDNSHFNGENMLGAMVVATPSGFSPKDYRLFKLKNPNTDSRDDYKMMREVLTRRLSHLTKEMPLQDLAKNPTGNTQIGTSHSSLPSVDDSLSTSYHSHKDNPDQQEPLSPLKMKAQFGSLTETPSLIIIDGGINQLNIAINTLNELGLSDQVKVLSIVKQENRAYGKERILLSGGLELSRQAHPNLYRFLLKLRDEAHSWALNSQRRATLKNSTKSRLDNIKGVGPVIKKRLLIHFKNLQNLKHNSAQHISSTAKISLKLAEKILESL